MAHDDFPRLGRSGQVVDQPVILRRAGLKVGILVHHGDMDRAVIEGPVEVIHVWIREVLLVDRTYALMVALLLPSSEPRPGEQSTPGRRSYHSGSIARSSCSRSRLKQYPRCSGEASGRMGRRISLQYQGSYLLLVSRLGTAVAVGEKFHGSSVSRRRGDERTGLTVYLIVILGSRFQIGEVELMLVVGTICFDGLFTQRIRGVGPPLDRIRLAIARLPKDAHRAV